MISGLFFCTQFSLLLFSSYIMVALLVHVYFDCTVANSFSGQINSILGIYTLKTIA